LWKTYVGEPSLSWSDVWKMGWLHKTEGTSPTVAYISKCNRHTLNTLLAIDSEMA